METPASERANPTPPPGRPGGRNNLIGASSTTMGILSICTGFVPCVGWISPIFTLAGLALGIYGIFDARRRGTSYTLCIIGIVLSLAGVIGFVFQNLYMSPRMQLNNTELK